ncbi:MAG: hypothetical protein WB392_12545, partial [Methanotrichaceae archaeon]
MFSKKSIARDADIALKFNFFPDVAESFIFLWARIITDGYSLPQRRESLSLSTLSSMFPENFSHRGVRGSPPGRLSALVKPPVVAPKEVKYLEFSLVMTAPPTEIESYIATSTLLAETEGSG